MMFKDRIKACKEVFDMIDENDRVREQVSKNLDEEAKRLDEEMKDLKVALTVSVVTLCVISVGFLSVISQVYL